MTGNIENAARLVADAIRYLADAIRTNMFGGLSWGGTIPSVPAVPIVPPVPTPYPMPIIGDPPGWNPSSPTVICGGTRPEAQAVGGCLSPGETMKPFPYCQPGAEYMDAQADGLGHTD